MPSITVRVSEETVRQLDELAGAMDRTRSWVVTDALARYLEDERQWMDRIEAGMASIDRGEGVPHEVVMATTREKIARHRKSSRKPSRRSKRT